MLVPNGGMASRDIGMWTRQYKNRQTGRLIVPAVSALFLAYFGFHAYHGEFGIYSKYRFEARKIGLEARLDEVRGARIELERRVQLLHDGTLEKDMLDEQARRALNLSHTDEITIMRDW
jgi:cell division protein FtsB